MARYTESVCKLCRRESGKLFLKGERCYTDKCAYDRRQYAPGQHGNSRSKYSSYGEQLRAKQRVKRIYGVLERQFKKCYIKASHKKGITGENMIIMMEQRLDNMVFRLGFASSRSEARQLVGHGHFLVNDRKVDIPSYLVKKGDVIKLREKSKKIQSIKDNMQTAKQREIPKWLELDEQNAQGSVLALPKRDEISMDINEQLIVELYSK